jgi:methanogenic corrinoid protein MtbC1
MTKEKDFLTLKWGTLKAWNFHSEKAIELLKEYNNLGSSMSAIMQEDTPRQKEIICELIDEGNFKKICLDWEGKDVSKEEAKKYIINYGK